MLVKIWKKLVCAGAALCLALLLLGACGKKTQVGRLRNPEGGGNLPIATITLEDGGVIKAELYPDKAPNTVNNFISLAKSGYFNGKVFHRAVAGFMIQGGSPTGDGSSAGFPYAIKGEFANNGFPNDLQHLRGVLSMARLPGRNDSASCQFFIMHADSLDPPPYGLDGDYATFGKVISGMDVVDRIATSPVIGDKLVNKPVIKSVTVDTKGVEYPEPETLPPIQ